MILSVCMCSWVFLPVNACHVYVYFLYLCMEMCACVRIDMASFPDMSMRLSLLLQCSSSCRQELLHLLLCRSQVKVILHTWASLSTYLCTHYMYIHMARCHDCTYIWVYACLYKLFLYNLSCLHRLVHVSLSVRSSIATRFLKIKIQFAIGKLKKIALKFNWTPTSRRDQRWALSLFGNAAGTLFFWKPCSDGNHLQKRNERGPKLQKSHCLTKTW